MKKPRSTPFMTIFTLAVMVLTIIAVGAIKAIEQQDQRLIQEVWKR